MGLRALGDDEVIAPDVHIVDLEPDGFGWLCRLLAPHVQSAAGAGGSIDEDELLRRSRAIEALASPRASQIDVLIGAAEIHQGQPSSPSQSSPWRRFAETFRRLGRDWWAVGGGWDGDELVVSLIAHVGDEGIDLLTSADYFGARPRRDDATELVARVEREGEVKLALLAELDTLTELVETGGRGLTSEGVLYQRGLDELLRTLSPEGAST